MDFTEHSLPDAIAKILELNNYKIEKSVKINGAEIDIIAKSISDPFANTLYIEATIQYVNNDKFGKDATKFIMAREIAPSGVCICISSSGFTADVKERAKASRIECLTYDEFFSKFESITPYIDYISNSFDLIQFNESYEDPSFTLNSGHEPALPWLSSWRESQDESGKWLVLLGEYGTGKTSLTKILQYRWINEHKQNPNLAIPFRIELRTFARQFDAKTLIHHFLDNNKLGHIPIEFVYHLMHSGRVILILDGYDEMAQFLNARERRACLSALADLANQGAKGILTSRPNYFTETEELRVFEALYATLEQNKYYLTADYIEYLDDEKAVDNLVTNYLLERYERHISDLSPEQTVALVRRKLKGDPEGQDIILSILNRAFREEMSGNKTSLSGKPVIITYLLQIVDDMKAREKPVDGADLSEWQLYKMIVDRLMLRDQQRSPTLDPQRRRRCLQNLAVKISQRDNAYAREAHFQEIIDAEFKADLRFMDAEERRHKRDELFEDIRGSATLTRADGGGANGWVFSHNSLREYLSAELFLDSLERKSPAEINIPITSAMRIFAASISGATKEKVISSFQECWTQRHNTPSLGLYLSLLWDLARNLEYPLLEFIGGAASASQTVLIDGVKITNISVKDALQGLSNAACNGNRSEFSEVDFSNLDLRGSSFVNSTMENTSFNYSDVSNVSFSGSWMIDCDFRSAILKDTDFTGLDISSSIIVDDAYGEAVQMTGSSAIGYLKYNGATTDEVADYFVFMHHLKFAIVEKIFGRLVDQRNSQFLGLTQKGESRRDPPFARDFLNNMAVNGIVHIDRNELVSLTDSGRKIASDMISGKKLPDIVKTYLS